MSCCCTNSMNWNSNIRIPKSPLTFKLTTRSRENWREPCHEKNCDWWGKHRSFVPSLLLFPPRRTSRSAIATLMDEKSLMANLGMNQTNRSMASRKRHNLRHSNSMVLSLNRNCNLGPTVPLFDAQFLFKSLKTFVNGTFLRMVLGVCELFTKIFRSCNTNFNSLFLN